MRLLLLAVFCGVLPNCHAFLPVLPINYTAVECAAAVQSANSTSTSSTVTLLHSLATAALAAPLHSITNTTLPLPNSTLPGRSDPHDYYSLDPYWWPTDDCNQTAYPFPEYLSYCQYEKLDAVNPDTITPDTALTQSPQQLSALIHDVTILSLAAVAFGASDFGAVSAADRAAEQLSTFFLADDTMMRPNLLFGQTRVGRNNGTVHGGRPQALIDMYALSLLLQAEHMLYRSNATTLWAAKQHDQWLQWVSQYEVWAVSSPQGQQVNTLHDRHYTWYTCQLVALYYHDGNVTAADRVIQAYLSTDYSLQFNATGGQPNEAGVQEWWMNSVSNAEALDCIASYSTLLNSNHSLYNMPNNHSVTLYNITVALLSAVTAANSSQSAHQQQRLLPLATHVLSVYGDGSDGPLSAFVSDVTEALGVQVYDLWMSGSSGNCTMPAMADASWAFYVQVLIIVGLTAIALAALAVCVWRTRESGETADEEEEGAGGEEGEEDDEEEEEEEEDEDEDDGVRLTHSRDSSLVSVMSGNDLNAVLLSDGQYDDAVVVQNGHVRPANGRRRTRVASGIQHAPTV